MALAQNVSQVRAGADDLATETQELTGLMQQSGSPPGQVLRGQPHHVPRLERLGRRRCGDSRLARSSIPRVPFLIGKDMNDLLR